MCIGGFSRLAPVQAVVPEVPALSDWTIVPHPVLAVQSVPHPVLALLVSSSFCVGTSVGHLVGVLVLFVSGQQQRSKFVKFV